MLLAELEVWHSRPVTPTRRVSLGNLILPVDPTPGFGGLLLGAVVAAHLDDILDEVEAGEMIPVINDGPEGDALPFESLNSFFLAGERLRKDARDADGLERLLDAIKIADPDRPPRGVELRVWRRSCELAEQLADVLVEGSEDEVITGAQPVAEALHDLLRPLV